MADWCVYCRRRCTEEKSVKCHVSNLCWECMTKLTLKCQKQLLLETECVCQNIIDMLGEHYR